MNLQPDFFSHAQRVQTLLGHSLSETDTRVHLIDPVLAMLGYTGISDLRREVPIPASHEFIDYELLIDGRPIAVVEAKQLRHAITDHDAAQCVQYASILGAPWCLITNGVVWQLFYAYATGPLEAKKVAQVRFDGDEAALADAARILGLVAKDSLTHPNPLTRLLVERVVIDELRRPDSPVVTALRRAVRDRFREQVSAQVVLDVLGQLWNGDRSVAESRVGSGMLGDTGPGSGSLVGPTLKPSVTAKGRTSLSPLIDAGLLPPDATLECRLYGITHGARVRDGYIELNGQRFASPSAAASFLRDGKASNGWGIWKYKGTTLADIRAMLPASVSADPELA